jgi:PKD repeat protein
MAAIAYLLFTAQLLLTAGITSISVSAIPTSVSAAGGTAAISAKVSDGVGDPAVGVPVRFSADNGSLSAEAVTTDETGTARVFLTTHTITNVIAAIGAARTAGAPARGPSAKVTVSVSPLPIVSISASILTNASVTFAIRAMPAARQTIVSLLVDYGDGQVESLSPTATSISHVYSAAGSYKVTATATDNLGGSGSAGTVILAGLRGDAG